MNELEMRVSWLVNHPELLIDLLNTGRLAPPATISGFNVNALPDLPGIYAVAATKEGFLKSLDQIIYIGVATKSIRARWQSHHKLPVFELVEYEVQKYGNFASPYLGIFVWVNPFATPEFLIRLENLLIQKLCPRCNGLLLGKNRDSEEPDCLERTHVQIRWDSGSQ